MYEQGEPPEYSREDWYKEKFNLGLDFPNVSSFKVKGIMYL